MGAHRFTWYWHRFKSYVGRPRLVVQTRAVLLDDDDYCEQPLFIVGPHRSGTSLVRRLFNSHPEIACPPESFYLTRYVDMLDDRHVQAGYDGFGYSPEQMRQDLARKASALHEAFRLAAGKRIWADKTPHYSLRLDGIDRLFAGQPRYILVLRHPGDVVHSIYRRGWRLNKVEDLFESALSHVRACLDAILDFEQRNSERCTRLLYAELCAEPERVLSTVMAQLGLHFHPAMLRFADLNHNFGMEDPVIRGTRTITPRHGDWRSLSPTQQARIREVFGPAVDRPDYWTATGYGWPEGTGDRDVRFSAVP